MYKLKLTQEDIDTIRFVGGRYCWSDALLTCCSQDPDTNELPEHVAWELAEAFHADTEGGHSAFPMLNRSSGLAGKLFTLWESIV